jgi:hypothetical protein
VTHVSLLPPNRTDWEAAIATVEAERPLPTHLVSTILNPATCPPHLLPYLAASLSVDVWDDGWTETKKREACRKAFELHRLKTTLAGIKAHVSMAGSEVKRAIRPPASGFLYAAMTEEQKKAWLDSLPQVRVYPFYRRVIRRRQGFHAGPGARGQFHSFLPEDADDRVNLAFVRKSRGFNLYGRRATLFDRGVEVEVGYETVDLTAERIFIGRVRRRSWHDGAFSSKFLSKSNGGERVVTVRGDDTLGLFAIGASVRPVDVRPQRIAQPRTAPVSRAFFGRFGGFKLPSFAPLLIYDRISIYDPSRTGARRQTRSFHGYGRFGVEDFSAELRIRVPMNRSRRRSGRWHGVGYRKAPDMKPLRQAIEAVRVSKAFRDTVMIDTATYEQAAFSGGLRFGEFTFGEIREVR